MATLIDWLSTNYPDASRRTLKAMVEGGRVRVNGEPARNTSVRLAESDRVTVGPRPRVTAPPPSLEPLRLVHEDDDVIVVEKPIGVLTSTTPREPRQTAIKIVTAYLAHAKGRYRPGLIHRLDKDASGLLVFTKNARAFEALKNQFFHHTVTRRYLAVVHGQPWPPKDRIESTLIERGDGTMRSTQPGESRAGQRAVTEYAVERSVAGRALVAVTLETGRKHQIRAHLSERGHPIVGDRWYGTPAQRFARASRLMLAAVHLAFDHPRDGKRLTFDLPAPSEFEAAFGGK